MLQSNTKTALEIQENYGDNLTILYARLSKEDIKKKDESYSITNQKILLENHAKMLGFTNIVFLADDGLSGVFFDTRPAFLEMMALVQLGKVKNIIVKDLSRLGRNYREAGECTETIFPYYNIRFVAIGDGVDKYSEPKSVRINTGFDINIAFKNLMNEGYIQDLSNKLRLAQAAKSSQGYAIGKPPYGYKCGEEDARRWEIDEDAAETVRLIYSLRLSGMSCTKIAVELRNRKIMIPSVYALTKGYSKSNCRGYRGDYFWGFNTISVILRNQMYVGDVLNFKTYTTSYKDRTKHNNDRENWDIHTDVHEPIIEREVWQQVQKSFERNVRKASKHIEKHPLAGYLKCSDCGSNLNYKHLVNAPHNDYFSCGNNRRTGVLCKKTHHIRIDALEDIVTSSISNIVRFIQDFEDDFVKLVVDEKYKEIRLQQARNKRQLATLKTRNGELDRLFESIYEDKVNGTLSEERFKKMSLKYENEQMELKSQLRHLQAVVDEEQSHELNAEGFIQLVRKYTRVNELTPEIVREFIDKIVVHHREENQDGKSQRVEIHFNMVGSVTLPNAKEYKQYIKSFSRTKKENQTAIAI